MSSMGLNGSLQDLGIGFDTEQFVAPVGAGTYVEFGGFAEKFCTPCYRTFVNLAWVGWYL